MSKQGMLSKIAQEESFILDDDFTQLSPEEFDDTIRILTPNTPLGRYDEGSYTFTTIKRGK